MSIKAKIAAELAERVKGGDGIAMDYASRMKRAKEQGFDTDAFHGTNKNIDSFRKGITYTSSRPDVANDFAMYKNHPDGANVVPVKQRGNYLEIDANYEDIRDSEKAFSRDVLGLTDDDYPNGMEVYDYARSKGFDGVKFVNALDDVPSSPEMGRPSDVYASFNPNQIRSTNAAFDPAKKNSSNLLGRATPRDMAVGTGVGLTSVAIADAYKDYMAKDKALADAPLFNFGTMVDQAPENFLNSVQDVASLSGLGDLVRGFALPVATAVGGIDEFNQVNDFVSEFEQPQTRAVNYVMNGVADAILPIYEELSPYISEDYNAIGSSEWPDDYRNPRYRGALNLAHDISRGTYSALTGTTRYLEDKFKE